MSDLEAALDLTLESVKSDHVALQCRVMSLLKLVHVLSQTKVQMGQQPSDIELEKVRWCMLYWKLFKLFYVPY